MKVPKGKRELNLIIDDVETIQILHGIGVKNVEDLFEEFLIVFERLFQIMRNNSYLTEGFGDIGIGVLS